MDSGSHHRHEPEEAQWTWWEELPSLLWACADGAQLARPVLNFEIRVSGCWHVMGYLCWCSSRSSIKAVKWGNVRGEVATSRFVRRVKKEGRRHRKGGGSNACWWRLISGKLHQETYLATYWATPYNYARDLDGKLHVALHLRQTLSGLPRCSANRTTTMCQQHGDWREIDSRQTNCHVLHQIILEESTGSIIVYTINCQAQVLMSFDNLLQHYEWCDNKFILILQYLPGSTDIFTVIPQSFQSRQVHFHSRHSNLYFKGFTA